MRFTAISRFRSHGNHNKPSFDVFSAGETNSGSNRYENYGVRSDNSRREREENNRQLACINPSKYAVFLLSREEDEGLLDTLMLQQLNELRCNTYCRVYAKVRCYSVEYIHLVSSYTTFLRAFASVASHFPSTIITTIISISTIVMPYDST